MKKTICVDIDGCIANIMSPWLEAINSKYKKNFTLDSINGYFWIEKYPLTKEEYRQVHLDARPYEDAIKYLERLNEIYNIVLVTSRNNRCLWGYSGIEDDTKKWLKQHSVPNNELVFKSDKEKVCSMLGAKFMIEDNPEIVDSFAGSDTQLILIERKWNRHVKPDKHIMLKTWKEIYEIAKSDD